MDNLARCQLPKALAFTCPKVKNMKYDINVEQKTKIKRPQTNLMDYMTSYISRIECLDSTLKEGHMDYLRFDGNFTHDKYDKLPLTQQKALQTHAVINPC